MQITVRLKMTSAHIGRPLCHCRRHVGAAVTAAMAAVLSTPLPPSPYRCHCRCHCHISAAIATTFWLIVVCPCTASTLATVACTRRCHCWLRTPLPPATRPQTAVPCPLLLLPQPLCCPCCHDHKLSPSPLSLQPPSHLPLTSSRRRCCPRCHCRRHIHSATPPLLIKFDVQNITFNM